MSQKLFKAHSIIPITKRKKLVRVDWSSYAFYYGRKMGLLTEDEVSWLKKNLEKRHGFSLVVEEFYGNEKSSGLLLDELTEYEDLELIPVRLIQKTEIECAYNIFGYVISFPLDNVSTVEDFLNVMDSKTESEDSQG
jgi:hypothetical protein